MSVRVGSDSSCTCFAFRLYTERRAAASSIFTPTFCTSTTTPSTRFGDTELAGGTMATPSSSTGPYGSRKAMTSFENLVALANYQEALRDARKMVWRDRGEPAVELNSLMECCEHAARGGIRELSPYCIACLVINDSCLGAGMLGFAARSGFNFFVLLFRIWKTPK